jgi:hypothetical protein
MIAKEIEEAVGLTAASAEMNVGNEESTVARRAVLEVHEESSFSVRIRGRYKFLPLQKHDIDR